MRHANGCDLRPASGIYSQVAGRSRSRHSELPHEPDLHLEPLTELLLDRALGVGDKGTDIGGGGVAEVDHDVGVDVGDLRVADAEALEAALVDEAAGADPL